MKPALLVCAPIWALLPAADAATRNPFGSGGLPKISDGYGVLSEAERAAAREAARARVL